MLTPPPPYQLRDMTLDDIDTVLAIDKHSFPTPAKARLYTYELTQNNLAHYQVLQINQRDQRNTILGYAGYWLIGDEVHVSTIAIHPQWRGQGLGELLLVNQLSMAYEDDARLVTLEVRESNAVAQALYKNYEFIIVGERRSYYKDTGESAILMTLEPLDENYHAWLKRKQVTLFTRLQGEGQRP